MPIDPGQQRMGSGVVCFLRVILLLPGDTQKTTTTRRTRAAWAVLHPVPHTYRLLCLLAVFLPNWSSLHPLARSRVGVVEAAPCPCALAVLHSHRVTCRQRGSGRGWTVVEAQQLGA
eukprot:scaffold80114_cov31-Phaeocystis_antarctica.AAC.2